ncbi:MAG: hypothetical protein AVDCRST_MAG45-2043, partial [uncultured Solirubrobacterales bacterium]
APHTPGRHRVPAPTRLVVARHVSQRVRGRRTFGLSSARRDGWPRRLRARSSRPGAL